MPKIDPNFLEEVKEEFYTSKDKNSKTACILISCKPAHEVLKELCEKEPVNYKKTAEKLKEIEKILHSYLLYKKHLTKIGYAIFLTHKYPLSFISYYILKKGYSHLNDIHTFFKKLPRKETKSLYSGFQRANNITHTWTSIERINRYRQWKLAVKSIIIKRRERCIDIDPKTIIIPERCKGCPYNKLTVNLIRYCDGAHYNDYYFHHKSKLCQNTGGSE